MSELPVRRSAEHLRKQAKRSARAHLISLAKAQHLLANEYGYRTWAQLIRDAALRADVRNSSPLFAAVRSGDVETVRRVPAAGANPNPGDGVDTPLHLAACRGPLSSSRRSLPAARLNGRRKQRDAYPWTSLNAENRLRDLRSSRYLIARLLQMHRSVRRSMRYTLATLPRSSDYSMPNHGCYGSESSVRRPTGWQLATSTS